MKTVLFKRIIISVFLQALFALSLFGQKYQNGTRLLKGAEVLSATPLQLDYVLENLSDTVKIITNIHEGKTHLVLNDGSGKWHEWWYYMGKWQRKQSGGSSGLESSIQTKHGEGFAGSTLGINEGFIKSLDKTPSDVGINNGKATIRVTPQSMAVMEATKAGTKGNITSNIYVAGNETEQNVTWISQSPREGARLRMDSTMLEHWQTSTGLDFWNFKSSLPDTTFYVKKRIRFDQPNTSVYIKNGDLRLTDKTGDFALVDLVNKAETDPTVPAHVKSITSTNVANWNTAFTNSHTHSNKTVLDGIAATNVTNWNATYGWGNHSTQGYLKTEADPVWTAASTNYYTKAKLQTSGQAQVHWDNITNKPATLDGYGITDAYTKAESRMLVGDTGTVLRQLIKKSSTSNTNNPGGTEGSIQYRSGNAFAGNNSFRWTNAFNGGHIYLGNAASLGGQPRLSAFTSSSSNYTELQSHDLNGRISFVNKDLQISSGQYLNINSMLSLNLSSQVTFLRAFNGYDQSELRMDGGYTSLVSPTISLTAGSLDEDNPMIYSNTVVNLDQKYGMTISSEYHDDTGLTINPHFLGIQTGYNLGQQALNIKNSPGAYVWKKYVEDNFAPKGLTGKIYWDTNEPVLPEESFAFWINGTNFYLIIRSGSIQKKVQLQ